MAKDVEVTPVVFRKWRSDGDITALFVADWAQGDCVNSFEHVGQHGAANYRAVMAATVPATETEYADLKAELEAVPYEYNLKVYQRRLPAHRKAVLQQRRDYYAK